MILLNYKNRQSNFKLIQLSESISPCVLWIDEIEKAFSGVVGQGGGSEVTTRLFGQFLTWMQEKENTVFIVATANDISGIPPEFLRKGGQGGGSEVTTRLFGQFLTWMQEKENTVFIVATANDISGIPPEFLRKGRFDELFFVDLPNDDERRKIIEIHIKKRNKWNREIDTIALIKKTEGFNGADLESSIKDAIESAFINGDNSITMNHLTKAIDNTKSISSTLKEKLEQIKKTISKMDIKSASNMEIKK